jgi:hypothetical protein
VRKSPQHLLAQDHLWKASFLRQQRGDIEVRKKESSEEGKCETRFDSRRRVNSTVRGFYEFLKSNKGD